jgi:hypothetical protein
MRRVKKLFAIFCDMSQVACDMSYVACDMSLIAYDTLQNIATNCDTSQYFAISCDMTQLLTSDDGGWMTHGQHILNNKQQQTTKTTT